MDLEQIIQTLIFLHAGLGGVALLAGAIALASKKGGYIHKTSGKVFYYSMLSSAMLSFIVSVMPNHVNPFLFCIGLFSTYFLLGGYRSLRFKTDISTIQTDKAIAYAIICIGSIMILYPVIWYNKLNIILTIFGIAGIFSGISDLRLYKHIDKVKSSWLKQHVGKMTGGYIGAVSAFFVVNQILPGIWNWFTPGIVGTVYITYWMRILDKKKN